VAGRSGVSGEPYTSLGQLALSRIRRRVQRSRGEARWYAGISEEERERLRPLGRRLLALVSEYMTKGARRSHLIDEAREIGHEYGKELVGDRLSIMELAQKNDLSAEEAVEVWDLLSNLADQVLLAIAEIYEQAETSAVSAN